MYAKILTPRSAHTLHANTVKSRLNCLVWLGALEMILMRDLFVKVPYSEQKPLIEFIFHILLSEFRVSKIILIRISPHSVSRYQNDVNISFLSLKHL